MYAEDFQFDNELASSYGLIICSFDGASGTTSIRNGADIELTTVRVPGSNVWNHINGRYNEVLSCTFQVAKRDCYGEDELEFSVIEQRAINRWLNRLDKFYPFRIVRDGYESIYYNAQINVNRIEIGSKVVGFEITVTTDKPYGYFEEQKVKTTIAADKRCSIVDISDDYGTNDIYMEIKVLNNGDLSIIHALDEINISTTEINNCKSGEIIIIDTFTQKISSNFRTVPELLEDFNFEYPTICNDSISRTNHYTFNLSCDVTIRYNPICKISF